MQECQQQAQFKLRLPTDLRDWLKAHGEKNHRKMTHEINFILDTYRQREQEQHSNQSA